MFVFKKTSVYVFLSKFTGKSNIHILPKLIIRYIKNISYYTFAFLCYILCSWCNRV